MNIATRQFRIFTLLSLMVTSVGGALAAGQALNGPGTLVAAEARGYKPPLDAIKVDSRLDRASQQAVERYQQKVGDAEVLGGQLTVYRDLTGEVRSVTGAHYPGLVPTNRVVLQPPQAEAVAAHALGVKGKWLTRLAIRPDSGRYFYVVENQQPDSRWFTWVDAESGMVVNQYDGLTYGDGIGVMGDTKSLIGLTVLSSGTYRMSISRQATYDAKNSNSLPGSLATDADDLWNSAGRTSPGQPALVDAQFYSAFTDNYLRNNLGWDWVAKVGRVMTSSVHLSSNYNNAYWNGVQMAYGDGDGTTFREFSGDLDVVAHELSHAITEKTSGLIYQNESGALNEAFSDIMGTVIEQAYDPVDNWTIGEDVTLAMYASDGTTKGIRSMANPALFGDPTCYQNRYKGTQDNGGVHWNSGIANHWFFLLVNGGQNAVSGCRSGSVVSGIGINAARDVAFNGFIGLGSTANFCAARAATVAYNSAYAANVAAAWDEVGVTSVLCGSAPAGGAYRVTVSTSKSSYRFNQSVSMTVKALDSSNTCVTSMSGATVGLTLRAASGKTLTGSSTTGSSCSAVFSYVPKSADGAGTWTATATVSKSGYTSGTGSATFSVTK